MKQKGFTLIELVVVIVILGILAATALPKFVDLADDAGTSAAQGVAGSISSATSMNYAKRQVSATAGVAVTGNPCTTGVTSANWANLVQGVTLTPNTAGATSNNSTYNLAGGAACAGAGQTVSCNLQGQKGVAVSATVVCTG